MSLFLHINHHDVIVGTETWLLPNVGNNEVMSDECNYNIYRRIDQMVVVEL